MREPTVRFRVALVVFVLAACGGEQTPPVEPGAAADFDLRPVEFSIDTGDVTLYARSVGGPGSVLVAVHGGPGLSSHYMEGLATMPGVAGPKRTFVTYDQRGGGRSTAPQSKDYSFARHAEDLEALRTFFEAETLHLFGHSWGAVIAMAYAIEHPDRVGSLIFFGGSPPTSEEVLAADARFNARIAQLQTEGVIPDPLPPPDQQNDNQNDRAAAIVPAYFADPRFPRPPEFAAMDFPISISEASLEAQVPFDMTSELQALELPVLILHGQDDPFGIEMARATEAAFSSAEVSLVLLPGCGHFYHECWDETAQALEPFLEALVP